MNKKLKLSKLDKETLLYAYDEENYREYGIFPEDIGMLSNFKKLCRMGLMKFSRRGTDPDSYTSNKEKRLVDFYVLTSVGLMIAATIYVGRDLETTIKEIEDWFLDNRRKDERQM